MKKQTKTLIIILVVLIVGYLGYRGLNFAKYLFNVKNKMVETSQEVKWLTHTDNEFGYSILYPSSWKVLDGVSYDGLFNNLTVKLKKFEIASKKVDDFINDIPSLTTGSCIISLLKSSQINTLTKLKDAIEEYVTLPQDIKNTMINDITKTKIDGIEKDVLIINDGSNSEMYFLNKDTFYVLSCGVSIDSSVDTGSKTNKTKIQEETIIKYIPIFAKFFGSIKFIN